MGINLASTVLFYTVLDGPSCDGHSFFSNANNGYLFT